MIKISISKKNAFDVKAMLLMLGLIGLLGAIRLMDPVVNYVSQMVDLYKPVLIDAALSFCCLVLPAMVLFSLIILNDQNHKH